MSFTLTGAVNPSKVFIEQKANLTGRWDPFYFRPELVALEKRVQSVSSRRLRDFVQSMAGGATPSTQESETHYTNGDEGIPFIRVQNLSTTGRLNLEDCKRITRNTHDRLLRRSILKGGELLVKITGVGRMAVASVVPAGLEANINQHIVAIRTNNIKTSERLAAYLNLDVAERLASRRSTGGTRPALDYPALLSLPIIFDKRIAKLMHKAVEEHEVRIQNADALMETLDDVLLEELGVSNDARQDDSLESRIFERDFSIVAGTRWDPLYHQGDIFHFIRASTYSLERLGDKVKYFITGFPAGRRDQVTEDAGGIIQIRPTNVTSEGELVFRRNVYIDINKAISRKSDLLQPQEVLFNNTNSQEQVGKTASFDLPGKYFASNHITRIGTHREQLTPRYLAYLLNCYQRNTVFYKLCTNWNNQSGVGNDILRRIPIPLPKRSRQMSIVERLDSVRKKAHSLRAAARIDFEAAKRSIQERVLEGAFDK